jgi:hypothetical protein
MTMKSLVEASEKNHLRRITFYAHLFFLSAMQLLYRRIISNLFSTNTLLGRCATEAIRDGLEAAKTAINLLGLMRQDGYFAHFGWMCM